MTRTASEQRLELYLAERGYEFEPEPDRGTATRPDYMVSRNGEHVVCEVKEFTTMVIGDRLEEMGGTAFMSPKQVFGAVRSQVDAAARQLKPLAGSGTPLVVVLSNPNGADVDLTPDAVVHALYGNPAVSVAIRHGEEDAPASDEPPVTFAGRDGALTAKHAYVSAVVTLHERTFEQDWADEHVKSFEDPWDFIGWAGQEREAGRVPLGSRRWVHIIQTAAAVEGRAAQLPDTFFDHIDDHAWSLDHAGAYVQLR